MGLLGDFLSPAHLTILLVIVAGIVVWIRLARAARDRQQREIGYLRGRLEERERQERKGEP